MATNTIFLVRGDTAANWEAKNTILKNREVAYDKTAGRLKVGDGTTAWKSLPYVKPDVINDLSTGGSDKALSAEMAKELKRLIDTKADITTVNNLEINLTQLINNSKVTVINEIKSTNKTTDALSAYQGYELQQAIGKKADSTTINNLKTELTQLINNSKVTIINNLLSTNTTAALSAYQGYVLRLSIDKKADITTVNNLKTELTNLINNSEVTVINNLTSTSTTAALSANQGKVLKGLIDSSKVSIINNLTNTSTTAALSAAMGKKLDDEKLAKSALISESWTFTLESGTKVQKKVALWSS